MAQAKKADPRVEVVLKKDHTHAGERCKPGDKIKVSKFQKKWLAERGVI